MRMAKYRYFLDARDHSLYRMDGGVTEILHSDGWRRYAVALSGTQPITAEGAKGLAGDKLEAPRLPD